MSLDPPRGEICSYCPTCKTLQDGQVHEAMTETAAKDKVIFFSDNDHFNGS